MDPTSSSSADMHANVAEIRADVSNLASTVQTFIKASDTRFGRLEEAVSESRGVNWGAVRVMVTVVAMASALIGFIVSGVAGDFAKHAELEGHPHALVADAVQAEKITALEREAATARLILDDVRSTRWTLQEGLDNRDRLSELEIRQARIEALLETDTP